MIPVNVAWLTSTQSLKQYKCSQVKIFSYDFSEMPPGPVASKLLTLWEEELFLSFSGCGTQLTESISVV